MERLTALRVPIARPRAIIVHRKRRVFPSMQNAEKEAIISIPEDELKALVRSVVREELEIGRAPLGEKWIGGTMVLKPGKPGLQEKEIPLEGFFHKIVMLRDRLRVLEQQINSNDKISDEEKVHLQQYITRCYGSLTTFNILFKEKADQFTGSKSECLTAKTQSRQDGAIATVRILICVHLWYLSWRLCVLAVKPLSQPLSG